MAQKKDVRLTQSAVSNNLTTKTTFPKKINMLLCCISGLLLGFSFPPFQFWYLAYFGIAVLLFLVYDSTRLRQALGRAYLSIFVWNAISLYWVGGWESNDLFLKIGGVATVLLHPVFFLIPISIFWLVYNRVGLNYSMISFPFIWTGYEFFDNKWQLSFPWLELGNTETYNLNRIQYIDITGVHGTSFIVCLIAVIILFLFLKISLRKWSVKSKPALVCYLVLLVLIAFPNFYSYSFLSKSVGNEKYFRTSDSSKIIKSAVIQPNVDPHKKWTASADSLIDSYIIKLNEAKKINPDLYVLHETTVPYYFFEDYNMHNTIKFINFVEQTGKSLLIGIPHTEYFSDSNQAPKTSKINKVTKRKYFSFNSAVLIEPHKQRAEYTIHKKVKLVPFSEYVPYSEYLPFLKSLINWGVGISSWNPGNELQLFTLQKNNSSHKFATLICFESVFSDYVSNSVNRGAEFLVIITNDGWFGNSFGPYQHEQYAVLRAIENRKWVIRCAQTGISCYIDPLGNIYDETKLNEEKIISKEILANDEQTFYSQQGDVVGRVSFYVSCFAVIILLISYPYNKIVKRRA